jgi:gamma-glutamylcyclotransferase (GGCT)/AIG2-like uncharacterized protein YtfP
LNSRLMSRAFFVYGTLMRGFGNHDLVAKLLKRVEPAAVSGVRLLHFKGGGFPAMLTGGHSVLGELLHPEEGQGAKVQTLLDELEVQPCDALIQIHKSDPLGPR